MGKYLFSELLGAITGARKINRALIATVGFVEILLRSNGDNAGWINGFMAAVIVVADMRNTHRLRDAGHLVDVAQKTVAG